MRDMSSGCWVGSAYSASSWASLTVQQFGPKVANNRRKTNTGIRKWAKKRKWSNLFCRLFFTASWFSFAQKEAGHGRSHIHGLTPVWVDQKLLLKDIRTLMVDTVGKRAVPDLGRALPNTHTHTHILPPSHESARLLEDPRCHSPLCQAAILHGVRHLLLMLSCWLGRGCGQKSLQPNRAAPLKQLNNLRFSWAWAPKTRHLISDGESFASGSAASVRSC